jgi:hypothetical protein
MKKAIYGLRQVSRTWYEKFASVFHNFGFFTTQSNPSLFIFNLEGGIVYVFLYVDDIILTGSCNSLINNVVSILVDKFKLKDLGKLSYFLGISINYSANQLFVSQK